MRVEGWESLLVEHIDQARGSTFQWGQHDCALWTAEWVRKCTGVDLSLGSRGQYRSKKAALTHLKSLGYRSAVDMANDHLSVIPVGFARRGDALLHPNGHLGICNGRNGVFVGKDGIVELSTLACKRAWRVE